MIKEFFSKMLSFKFTTKGFLNPFIGLQINSIGDYKGVNELKREVPLIISLSSTREHFGELPITIYSLLNQSLKPDRIILWLDKEYEDLINLPYEITQFIKNGLEIKFVDRLESYTNFYYSIKDFSNSVIVYAEDNIYYPNNWLKKLYLSYASSPNDIHSHITKAIVVTDNKLLLEEKFNEKKSSNFTNFPVIASGVLFPPNCFTKEALRSDIFLKQAPDSIESWVWIMSLLNNHKIRIVQNNINSITYVNTWRDTIKPMFTKTKLCNKQADALNNLMRFYGRNIILKIKS